MADGGVGGVLEGSWRRGVGGGQQDGQGAERSLINGGSCREAVVCSICSLIQLDQGSLLHSTCSSRSLLRPRSSDRPHRPSSAPRTRAPSGSLPSSRTPFPVHPPAVVRLSSPIKRPSRSFALAACSHAIPCVGYSAQIDVFSPTPRSAHQLLASPTCQTSAKLTFVHGRERSAARFDVPLLLLALVGALGPDEVG